MTSPVTSQVISPVKSTGTLILVATPIGNLGDFSPRGGEALAEADIIACEDTRVTRKLLTLTATSTNARLVAYHDHNGAAMRPRLLEHLAAGRNVVLVSDAGTPLISDPGYKLVAACREQGIPVTSVPGPSAVLAALAISGLPTDRFMFAGFVPSTTTARQEAFRELASLSATSIWFATPSKLATCLADMAEIFGQRQAVITRELTKLHEEVLQGTLSDLATSLSGGAPLKGEIVLVVAGRARDEAGIDDATLDAMLRAELEGQRLREAVKSVVASTGLARNHVYRRALQLNEESQREMANEEVGVGEIGVGEVDGTTVD